MELNCFKRIQNWIKREFEGKKLRTRCATKKNNILMEINKKKYQKIRKNFSYPISLQIWREFIEYKITLKINLIINHPALIFTFIDWHTFASAITHIIGDIDVRCSIKSMMIVSFTHRIIIFLLFIIIFFFVIRSIVFLPTISPLKTYWLKRNCSNEIQPKLIENTTKPQRRKRQTAASLF